MPRTRVGLFIRSFFYWTSQFPQKGIFHSPLWQSIRQAANTSEEKRELGSHCSGCRLLFEVSLFSHYLSFHGAHCPQILTSSGSTSVRCELFVGCLGPVGSGLCSFWTPLTHSPIFHSIPHLHLLRYLVHPGTEHFQILPVQNILLFGASSPTSLNFTLLLMLCLSYHWFILFRVFII